MPKAKFTTSFALKPLIEAKLRERSRKTGASLSKLVEFALVDYLGIREEYEAELDRKEALYKQSAKKGE